MALSAKYPAALGRVVVTKEVRAYIDETADKAEVSMGEVVRVFLEVGIEVSKVAAELGVTTDELIENARAITGTEYAS